MKETVILSFMILYFCPILCEDIEVDLAHYHPNNKSPNVFQRYVRLSEDKTKVKIENINDDVGFFIIQVHSYIENVTLSYNSTTLINSYITGTNIGLVYGYEKNTATFYIFRNIKFDKDAPIVLIITVYDASDPVPGGCSQTFNTEIAPYQIISYNDDYIRVESQPPSAYGVTCDDDKIQVDMYHMFLYAYEKNVEIYFEGITQMLTVENIKLYGKKVPPATDYFKYSRLYSSYRGIGEVFAIIATYNNRSSAYVPAVSYGCDLVDWNSCVYPVTEHWKFICASLLILGLFTCFFGHIFFRFTLYLVGFTFGVLITYLAVSYERNFSTDEKILTSLIIGFFYGVIWVFIWWKYGVPLLSVHLSLLLAGFLVASTIFYAGLANISIYNNDFYYWITLICIVLVCQIIWILTTMYSHIFCCSLLGSYASIVALNYYLGGNLQYIVINTYRRATVKLFYLAVIDPPFQVIDLIQSLLWIFLVGFGCYIQLRDQKGRPPFPPNRNRAVSRNNDSERTPLIPSESVPVPEYV